MYTQTGGRFKKDKKPRANINVPPTTEIKCDGNNHQTSTLVCGATLRCKTQWKYWTARFVRDSAKNESLKCENARILWNDVRQLQTLLLAAAAATSYCPWLLLLLVAVRLDNSLCTGAFPTKFPNAYIYHVHIFVFPKILYQGQVLACVCG